MNSTKTRAPIWTLGATAAVAASLLLAGAGTADAGKRNNKRDVELVRPSAAPDADASGVLRITTSKRGEKGLLKLRNLDAKTRYEVHDGDTDEVLGIVRTDRRGKAKMKLRRKVSAVGKSGSFDMPGNIEICRLDDDTPLLVGDTDVPELGEAPAFGFGHYEGAPGWAAFVDMFSFAAEDMEGFHLSLSSFPTRDDEMVRPLARGPMVRGPIDLGETYDYSRDTFAGDELPLGVDSVAELAGRAFRIVDADDNVLVRGVLPELQRPEWQRPEWGMPELPDFPQRPEHGGGPNHDRPPDARGPAGKFGGLLDRLPEFDMPAFGWDWDVDALFQNPDRPNADNWDFIDIMPPDFMPFPAPEREESDLRLEIADENGDLTDVGNLDRIIFPEIDWPEWPAWECPMDGDEEPDATERDPATNTGMR